MLKIALMTMGVLLVSCSSDEQTGNGTNSNGSIIGELTPVLDPSLDDPLLDIFNAYLNQIDSDNDTLSSSLANLADQISAFLESPQSATMEEARSAWIAAHSNFEINSLHRYFADSVLADQESLALYQIQYQMNHWPILPGYVDYVEGYGDSGIVNDINVELTIPSLQEQHGAFDLAEAALGFHVLEFLLWGENKEGQSPRSPSDYFRVTELSSAEVEIGLELEQLSNNRRREYLALATEALIADFEKSRSIWNMGSSEIQAQFESINGTEVVIILLETMAAMLTEEQLVRSLYPLLNGEFVDSIQSPYSLSTQNAVTAQLSSVERLLLETRTSDGRNLDSVLLTLSADFADFFYQNFDASKECLVVLYSSMEFSMEATVSAEAEFEIVECINSLTNMIDYLEQIKISLSVAA